MARRGEGSVRDAVSLLDQIIAFSGRSVTAIDVATILGLSDTTFFARLVGSIGDGDPASILESLQEASDTGRDFKMLYRDLLAFVRNLLLLAGGANEAMLAASPEDLIIMRAAREKFSYTELLRIANLLLRDDETVNRAEHQRLAVEIALLKAATFPKLRSVEEAIAGGGAVVAPSGEKPARAPREAQPSRPQPPRSLAHARDDSSASGSGPSLVERVKKVRPLVAGYLEGAKIERDGNKLTLLFTDSFAADTVSDARDTIAQIASEMYGAKITVEAKVSTPETGSGRRDEDKPPPLSDDPVLSAFRKHLGGELVKEKR